MPEVTYYRRWCKTCEEYTVQSVDFADMTAGDKCHECKEPFVATHLLNIPKEKRDEQQERYRAFKKRQLDEMASYLFIQPIFSQERQIGIKVVEDDAGYEQQQKLLREYKLYKLQQERLERQKYEGTGRNEQCPCGSGLKFKKCHLPGITN